jgi:hypothetical protein
VEEYADQSSQSLDVDNSSNDEAGSSFSSDLSTFNAQLLPHVLLFNKLSSEKQNSSLEQSLADQSEQVKYSNSSLVQESSKLFFTKYPALLESWTAIIAQLFAPFESERPNYSIISSTSKSFSLQFHNEQNAVSFQSMAGKRQWSKTNDHNETDSEDCDDNQFFNKDSAFFINDGEHRRTSD